MVLDILKGIFSIFIHPLFYLIILAQLIFGYQRIRRERLSFGLKVYGILEHMGITVIPSLIVGLIGSVVMLGVGIAVPYGFLVLITLCYVIILVTLQVRYVSATVAVGLAILVSYFLPNLHTQLTFINRIISDIHQVSFQSVGSLLVVTLIIESILISFWGTKQISPRLINSKRGKKVGALEANQLWLFPLFMLIPISSSIPRIGWWPLTYTGLDHFSLLLVPFAIGFQQLIGHTVPEKAVSHSAKWVVFTTGFATVLVGLDWWLHDSLLIIFAAGLAVLSRISLIIYHQYLFTSKPFFLSERQDGLIIVGVIPDSPADSMEIKVGERIRRVNEQEVHSEVEFYEAIQLNAAFCKLEVIDHQNELRLVHSAIYERDYHTIGLLFLESSKRKSLQKAK